MAFAALALGSCTTEPQTEPLNIDNQLSAEEISAAQFTPTVMWKMGRVGSVSLSPDASKAIYTITRYNMAENRGISQIYLLSGGLRRLTSELGFLLKCLG